MSTTGFIWTRKSNQHDKVVYTLESQLAACLEQAGKDGVSVPAANVYRVRFSGVDLFQIPELDDLFRRLEADRKQPKIVYVYVQDRMIRGEEGEEIFYITTRFRKANAKCFVVNPGVEITSGDFATNIQTLFSGHKASSEWKDILRRTWEGRLDRMTEGKIPGAGPNKYGFKRIKETGKAVVVEEQAFVIRKAATLIEAGNGLKTVANLFAAESIPSPTGKGWSATTVRSWFVDPAYKGSGYGWRWSRPKYGKLKARNIEDQIPLAPDAYPAIVEPARWDRINQLVKDNRGIFARNKNHFALLRGMIFCTRCDAPCYLLRSGNNRAWRYRCSSTDRARRRPGEICRAPTSRAEVLDEAIWEYAVGLLRDPDELISLLRSQWPAQDRQNAADLETLQRAAKEKESQLSRLAARLRDASDLIAGHIQTEMNTVERERRAVLQQCAEIERLLAADTSREAELIELRQFAEETRTDLDGCPGEHQRYILQRLRLQYVTEGDAWRVRGAAVH